MKYILIIISLFILTGCTPKTRKVEDYNYLPVNSIRFIKEDDALLINSNNKYYLLLLDKESNVTADYIISVNDIDDSLMINDLIFKKNDKLEIVINNKNFCIYIEYLDKDNYRDCDFLYLYNIKKDFYINITSDLLILFYDAYTKFNYKFMLELAEVWIDSYTVSVSSYTTLTIYENNFLVSSIKRRGKTIHKP